MISQVTVNGSLGQTKDLPRSAYTCSGGVCTGTSAQVTGILAGLQRSLNALAARVAGMASLQVTVDGKIGPKTTDAVKRALPALFPNQPIPQDSMTVTQMAPALAEMFFARAAVVADYSPPPTGSVVPRQTDSNGMPVPMPSEDGPPPKKGMHWGWWLGGAVVVIGLGYFGYRWVSGGRGSNMRGSDEHGYDEAVEDFIDV